ncbi:MAG: hypothetical protein M0R46_17795 [Candidatus Muirbacterium halophilum]|nr:hypothetical protein [Candidatus Muirbacterium halophilum]
MNYLKTFNQLYETDNFSSGGAYPGPQLNSAGGNLSHTLAAGGSDGQFGNSSAMGGEYPKKSGPTSSPYPTKYKEKIKKVQSKESKRRKSALKKLMKLDKAKMKSFDDFQKDKD